MSEWLGWVGSALCVTALCCNDQRRFRVVNSMASAVFLVMNLMIGVTSMVVLNAVLIAINIRHLVAQRLAGRAVVAAAERELVQASGAACGPRTSEPGSAPVCSPAANVSTPAANVCR